MSGINSLSGLNKVNLDFMLTVSLDEQRKVDANEPGQPQGVAPGSAQPAKVDSVVRKLDVLLLGAAKKSVVSDIVRNVETVGDTLVKKGVLTKEEIVQSDGRKVEVDDSKGQFVSEYFRTSCPSYYKRDYYDKMF